MNKFVHLSQYDKCEQHKPFALYLQTVKYKKSLHPVILTLLYLQKIFLSMDIEIMVSYIIFYLKA